MIKNLGNKGKSPNLAKIHFKSCERCTLQEFLILTDIRNEIDTQGVILGRFQ